MSCHDLLSMKRKKTKREVVKRALLLYLADGPKYARDVYRYLRRLKVCKQTIDLAKKELRIISEKQTDWQGSWYWRLPIDSDDSRMNAWLRKIVVQVCQEKSPENEQQ